MRLNKLVVTGKIEGGQLCAIAIDIGYNKSELDKFMLFHCRSVVTRTSEFPATANIVIGENIFTVDDVKYNIETHERLGPDTHDLMAYGIHHGSDIPDAFREELHHAPWLADEWNKMKMIDNHHIVITSDNRIRNISKYGSPIIDCPVPMSRVVKLLAYCMSSTVYLMAKLDDGKLLYWTHTDYPRDCPVENMIKRQGYIDPSLGFYDFGLGSHGFIVVSETKIRMISYDGDVYDTPYAGEVQLIHGYGGNEVVISNVLYSLTSYDGLSKVISGVYGLYISVPISK